MNEIFEKLLSMIIQEKDVIERLLEIDNERNFSNITFDEFYNNISRVIDNEKVNVVEYDTLFITEGDPYLTLHILKCLVSDRDYVIYVNQGFLGLNEWIVTRFKQLCNDFNISLDSDINYNKYIGTKKYKILPLGEKEMVEVVLNDFGVNKDDN